MNSLISFQHLSSRITAIAIFALSAYSNGNETQALPERTEDIRAFLADELATGKKRIVIPPGRYRLNPQSGTHLTFSKLKDIEIIAKNVELVCTATVRALLFEECTNVTLRGLAIDYDPLPFTQGKIVAMATDKSWIDFEVSQGYPENEFRAPFQIYNPKTGTLRRGDANWDEKINSLGQRRYRVTKSQRYRFSPDEDIEQIGDILVAKNSCGKSGSPHAFELRDCRGMRFEDITVYASPSFGFLERHCHRSTYLRCTVDRRSPEDDPIKRAQPRMRSLNADAFHSKDATKGPAILSCTARFMGDDAVNINGRYHYVRSSKGRELRIAVVDKKTTIKPGDPLEFLPYSGPLPPNTKVIRRQPDPTPLTAQEKAFIRKLPMDKRMRGHLLDGHAAFYILTLDKEISLPPGSAVCCPLRLGNGFAVKNCDFSDTRSRGILIKASNGEIIGNRLNNTGMASLLVSPEFWWMEAGLSSNLMIRENTIIASRQTPIQIHARGGNRQLLPAGALRNISILNNRFEDCAWPLIRVTSTTGLIIKDNIMPPSPPYKTSIPAEPILLEKCKLSP